MISKKRLAVKEVLLENYHPYIPHDLSPLPDLPKTWLSPHIVYSINLKEKPLPQDNNSEVLKALNDHNLPTPGVAGMAELQEDRTESMIKVNEEFLFALPFSFSFWFGSYYKTAILIEFVFGR